MASYAATISYSSISSDARSRSNKSAVKKGKSPLSTSAAVGQAKGHLQYILNAKKTDPDQHGDVIHCHQGNCKTIPKKERAKFKKTVNTAIVNRAIPAADTLRQKRKKGAKDSDDLLKKSVRVMDKIIVSLPNDASLDQQREIGSRILQELCGDSEAHGICAIHGDAHGKNNHLHIALIDGLESLETAKKRARERAAATGKKTKVRRAYQINFNDMANRKTIRERIGSIINEIADRDGLTNAEIRSLKAQGIERKPQRHEGPKGSQARRDGKFHRRAVSAINHNIKLLAQQRMPADPLAEVSPFIFPERLRVHTDPLVRKQNEKRKAQASIERVSKALVAQERFNQLKRSESRLERVEGAVWRHNDVQGRLKAIQRRPEPSRLEKPLLRKLLIRARMNYSTYIAAIRKAVPELAAGSLPWIEIRAAVAARISGGASRSNGSTAKDRQVSTEQTIHRRQRRRSDDQRD